MPVSTESPSSAMSVINDGALAANDDVVGVVHAHGAYIPTRTQSEPRFREEFLWSHRITA